MLILVRRAGVVCAGLVAIVMGIELGLFFRLERLDLPSNLSTRSVHLAGALHVHTTRSDGRAALNEVAIKASEAGLDLIGVSEHNLAPLELETEGGLSILAGTELSTSMGHLLAWGRGAEPSKEERERAPFFAGAKAGSLRVLAHPINRRRPWSGPFFGPAPTQNARSDASAQPELVPGDEALRVAGMEVVSGDSAYREALAHPLRLLTALMLWPLDQQAALLELMVVPSEALTKYRSLLREGHEIQAFCGHDAHGLPNYEAAFRLMRTEWPPPFDPGPGSRQPVTAARTTSQTLTASAQPKGDPSSDAAQLIQAMAKGETRCVLNALGSADSFDFLIASTGVSASFSPTVSDQELDALGVELRLYRDGELVATGRRSVPEQRVAGMYHVEVSQRRPWLFGTRSFLWVLSGLRSWAPSPPVLKPSEPKEATR